MKAHALVKILGAILAGGQSSRFGSDKANAIYRGARLIDLVRQSLEPQCNRVIICGREESGLAYLADRPSAGLGPLGGLNAALAYARTNGFTHVLSTGVDVPNLPGNLAVTLGTGAAAIVADQPVVGLWPADLSPQLDEYLRSGARALYGFAEVVGARRVVIDPPLLNVNRPADLQ